MKLHLEKEQKCKFDETYFKQRYFYIFSEPYDESYLDYRNIAKFASVCKDEVVVEVGCGLGTLSWVLSKYSPSIIGIDISIFAIQQAKKFYSKSGAVTFMVASGTSLPFRDGTINCVVCSHLLEHLSKVEAEEVQREAFRVLKNGGRIVAEQPFEGEKRTLLDFINGRIYPFLQKIRHDRNSIIPPPIDLRYPLDKDATHKRDYTISLLVSELEDCGFTMMCARAGLFKRLDKILSLPFLILSLIYLKRGGEEIFSRYLHLYAHAPEIIRRLLFVTLSPMVKALKLNVKTGGSVG